MYKALDDNPNGWYVIAVDKVHVGSKSADLGSGTGIIDTGWVDDYLGWYCVLIGQVDRFVSTV